MNNKEKYGYQILNYLSKVKEADAREMSIKLNITQSEISMVTNELYKMKFIDILEERHIGKGRPVNIYKLRKSLQEIKGLIRIKIEDEMNEKLKEIYKYLNGVN